MSNRTLLGALSVRQARSRLASRRMQVDQVNRESTEMRTARKKVESMSDKELARVVAQTVWAKPIASTWDGLTLDWQERISNAVAMKAAAVGYLTSFVTTHKDPSEFPFDLQGVAYIEEYLLNTLKPRNEDVTLDVQSSGFVLGQCLAQMYGGKWVCKDDNRQWPHVKIGDVVVNPYAKPVKFFANGDEDSLVAFARMCDPAAIAKQSEAFDVLNEWSDQRGISPKDYRLQIWAAEDGAVDYFKVYHGSSAYLIPISKSARQSFAQGHVRGDVVREELDAEVKQ